MIRRSTLLFACIAIAVGMGLFHIKYQVVVLENEYKQTNQHIKETLESIHVLKAEWSHLNDPKRLQTLSQKYLGIGPMQSGQFISMRAFAKSEHAYDKYSLDQLIAEVTDDLSQQGGI